MTAGDVGTWVGAVVALAVGAAILVLLVIGLVALWQWAL